LWVALIYTKEIFPYDFYEETKLPVDLSFNENKYTGTGVPNFTLGSL